MNNTLHPPRIRRHLLWDFDGENFDFVLNNRVVIERVIERGNMDDWREMVGFYGRDRILEVARSSTRLDARHKHFTKVFLPSAFLKDV